MSQQEIRAFILEALGYAEQDFNSRSAKYLTTVPGYIELQSEKRRMFSEARRWVKGAEAAA